METVMDLSRPDPANDELTVLVVNDQADILDEVAELLRRRGLPVETAEGCVEAARILADRPGIGVVVAGTCLLQGAGFNLASALLGSRAAPELLLISGWDRQLPAAVQGPGQGQLGLLREPLSPRHLERAVHQALGRAVASRAAAGRAG
jgi:DNA-binding NtrC family response regulator